MKLVFVLIMMMYAISAEAAMPYNDKMIAAIAKTTNSSKEEVLASLKTGCDSGITIYMRQCSFLHSVAADIKLNAVYQQLLKKLQGTGGVEKLRPAQRAWLAFRNANCAFDASSWEGGTGHSITVSTCETDMAEKRTRELGKYLRCDDNGCPGSN